jgi:hypothetical protein
MVAVMKVIKKQRWQRADAAILASLHDCCDRAIWLPEPLGQASRWVDNLPDDADLLTALTSSPQVMPRIFSPSIDAMASVKF